MKDDLEEDFVFKMVDLIVGGCGMLYGENFKMVEEGVKFGSYNNF